MRAVVPFQRNDNCRNRAAFGRPLHHPFAHVRDKVPEALYQYQSGMDMKRGLQAVLELPAKRTGPCVNYRAKWRPFRRDILCTFCLMMTTTTWGLKQLSFPLWLKSYVARYD